MIVDSFTHMVPSPYLDKLAALPDAAIQKRLDSARQLVRNRPAASHVAPRVELLDKYGIDYQVVTLMHNLDCNMLPLDAGAQLSMSCFVNDAMAQLVQQSRGRLVGVACAPLAALKYGGLDEMERAIKTLGLKGFGINSNIGGKPVDTPEFAPFWAKAAELEVPVFLHPANPVSQNGRAYEADYSMTMLLGWPFETVLALTRLVLSGILDQHPTLKVVSHHLGGGLIPFLWGRIEEFYIAETQQKELGRTLPRPLKDYYGRFYYDTAVGTHGPAIRCCYETFGADRMLLSTDFPHGTSGEGRLEGYPRTVRECGIPAKDVEKILGGNAQRLLGLE